MALTKAQKKMAGVIAVGGAALFADRFIFSGGAPADAAQAESLLVSKGDAGAKDGVKPGQAPATQPSAHGWGAQHIGARLSASFDRNGKPVVKGDPFHLPVVVVPQTVAPVVAGERPGMTFARSHVLKAIMASGRGGSALLNDQLVHEGDTVSDWRVVEISPAAVLFEKGSERVKLGLSDPGARSQTIK